MKFKPRPGIVRTKICGQYILIPAREASDYCDRIIKLSLMGVALLEELEKGKGTDNICVFFQKLSKKSEKEVQSKIDRILSELYEKGYLIKEGVD